MVTLDVHHDTYARCHRMRKDLLLLTSQETDIRALTALGAVSIIYQIGNTRGWIKDRAEEFATFRIIIEFSADPLNDGDEIWLVDASAIPEEVMLESRGFRG